MKLARHHFNTAVYLAVSVLARGVSLLLIPLYTKRLTPSDYGLYGLCQTFFWLAPPLVSLGMAAAFSRFYFDTKDPVERKRTVGSIGTFVVVVAGAMGLAGSLAVAALPPPWLGELGPRYLGIVVWICACMPVSDLLTLWLRASEKALHFAVINMAVFLTTAGATLLFMLRYDLGLAGLLYGMLAGQVLGASASVVLVFAHLRPRFDRRTVLAGIEFSVPFIPHMIGNALMVGTDRWVLGHYGFHDGLGLYTLATQLTVPMTLATAAWNEASSPSYFATWRDGGWGAARRRLPRIVGGFALAAGGALTLVLAGMPLLKLLVGERFRAAFPLVPWIGLGLIAGTPFSAFVNVLSLRKRTRIIPVLTLTSAAVNLGLNVVLVPRFGVMGAIAGTGVAYAFRTGLLARFALRLLAVETAREAGLPAEAARA